MTAKNNNVVVKTLTTALIAGGLSLAALTTTGCDTLSAEQIAALTSASAADVSGLLNLAEKAEQTSKLSANHNETFLVRAAA